jgi:ADP-heptose:LPS heptosyltransferase
LEWLEQYPDLHLVALAGKPREFPDALKQHPRWLDLCGKTSLTEMVSWIQAVDGVVVNDSGPMHIAAALDKPLIALFGATPPERFGPYPLSNPKFQVLVSATIAMTGLKLQTVVEAAASSFNQSLGRK